MSQQQPAAKPSLQSVRIKARKGAVKAQFLKYSDALFDILFVGGLLQPGSSYLDADDSTSPFSLFQINAPAETEDIKKFIEVGTTTRFPIIVPCHPPLCRQRRRPQQRCQQERPVSRTRAHGQTVRSLHFASQLAAGVSGHSRRIGVPLSLQEGPENHSALHRHCGSRSCFGASFIRILTFSFSPPTESFSRVSSLS
ncbi:hypothetical protein BJY52DRAFT_846584 [Lactarius psammicola]|nr:hypothetical protein BJY52DRAFT_846584 [Lactarius psammicola]